MAHTLLEIKNASVKAKVGTGTGTLTEFGDSVDVVSLDNSATSVSWKPVSGKNQTSIALPDQIINLNVGDSLTSGELWEFLYTNHGKQGQIEILPNGGTTPKIAATVTFMSPAKIGGQVGVNSSAAALPVVGRASITFATAAP